MPSDKKRINLTVPDDIYQEIQWFKTENGIFNDASACVQLIVKGLMLCSVLDQLDFEEL